MEYGGDVYHVDRKRLRLLGTPPFPRGRAPHAPMLPARMAWIYWGSLGHGEHGSTCHYGIKKAPHNGGLGAWSMGVISF